MPNPILPAWEYIPDGEPRVFGDRVYLYGSHDRAAQSDFCDYKLKVWSAPLDDLNNWVCHGHSFHTRDDRDHKSDTKGMTDRKLFAPDVIEKDGRYYLYAYIVGSKGVVGVSDKPEGPFTDHGKMFRSNEINVQNSIDPFYIEDGGKKYLFWGSFRGIYGIELSDDGLSVRKGAKLRRVAGTAYEGTYIHKKDGYYYFFASIGTCCEGLKSTYTTVVGRSKKLFGPYVDKSGKKMLDNHHEVLIHKNDAFVGTGHNSEIVTDKAGNDWMFYHAVSTKNPGGRVLMMDKVDWKDGWPSVTGNSPSIEAERPEM